MALPTFAASISTILEIEAKTDRSGQQPEEYHFGESPMSSNNPPPVPITIVVPKRALTDTVEAIWDWENSGGVLPVSLPSPNPQIVLHYRAPMWSDRRRSPGYYRCIATGLQTGLVNFRRSGPAGVVLVRLRLEAASRVLNANIAEFVDNNFALADIFGQSEVTLLQEILAEAKHTTERIACVEAFLLRHLRKQPISIFGHAACSLRRNPRQSMS
jgi:hypothetical protein